MTLMAPVPLEGHQTPVTNMPQEGNRGGSISLGLLIDFIIQRTYHELTVLAELLPRKTDMERKIEIYNFSARTRQLFVRLLALVKWASSATKVEKSAHIMAFLDKHSLLFVDTADILARMARETLVHARLPNFHLPAAVEVLTTGSYNRLPACIREKIVPPDPITLSEKRSTLQRLNQVIQHRLVTGNLMPQMKDLEIDAGRVTFRVEQEFSVSLTVMGDGPNLPWRLLDLEILVSDRETGDGKSLVHPLQTQYVHQVVQARLSESSDPLAEVYHILHYFCQSLQLEVLYSQTLRLIRDRLDDHIRIDKYISGECLTISYWKELTNKDSGSELGYKLSVLVDQHDPAKPLAIVHTPSLANKECEISDLAIRSNQLSMEYLLVHTIYIRTRNRLTDLKQELQCMFKGVECTLAGSPAILSVPVLQPCLRAELLLIAVDTHTGMLQCHIPQYDAPLVPDLTAALNEDHLKLPALISELRFWITQKRCEKTLQHLPATSHEKLPLLYQPDHPITSISKHRMYVQFHRHPTVILIVSFKENELLPCEIQCSFYLCAVKASSTEQESHDDSIETKSHNIYLKLESLIEFDTFVVTHGSFTSIDCESNESESSGLSESGDKGKKRRSTGLSVRTDASGSTQSKRTKSPAYFIPELAHVVALCDEQIPFVMLAQELTKREIAHQGLQIEANATALVLKLVQLPAPSTNLATNSAWNALLKRLLSVAIRVQGKGTGKTWLAEFVFYGSPLISSHPKEQGLRRPIYFQYEMGTIDTIPQMVDSLLNDWAQIVNLYSLVHDLSEYYKMEKSNLRNIANIKSYNYSKLIMSYGPYRRSSVTVQWDANEKTFKLFFGKSPTSTVENAHSLLREQLEANLNRDKNLMQIIHILNETLQPLTSISKLPIIPQLGLYEKRIQIPVQTFIVMPQCISLVRIAYQSMYCLELCFRGDGLVSLRDGAYSRFDHSNVVEGFTPIQGLSTFLSQYVDKNAIYRRRSQSEDDNPPSPPQQQMSAEHARMGNHVSRVLPQRSWAGAIPTILTYDTLELLCSCSKHPAGVPGPDMSPLERFLGCVFMIRQLKRLIQMNERENPLSIVNSTEFGVIHFKVESLQCRVSLNPQNMQSLHIKIQPVPESGKPWTLEDLQALEKFFDSRVVAAPYKPNNLQCFINMLLMPHAVLKDFIQIMKLELIPSLVQQHQMKWAPQWCLRVPPSAMPIIPVGYPAILLKNTKILYYLHVTRLGVQCREEEEPPSLILPLVYDTRNNVTLLANERDPAMAAVLVQLKRFAEYGSNSPECTLFAAVRNLLINLTLPSETVMSQQMAPNMAGAQVAAGQQIPNAGMQMMPGAQGLPQGPYRAQGIPPMNMMGGPHVDILVAILMRRLADNTQPSRVRHQLVNYRMKFQHLKNNAVLSSVGDVKNNCEKRMEDHSLAMLKLILHSLNFVRLFVPEQLLYNS
ncbi:hypothetical protein TSAR_004954 [Trichomalopsis sarcophagae]|uniref:Mediator of RNA polymerase II transcription subunit 14 n=1 Tax=Trichomalopsis sarcophagae TaxID=543379 RepID=A0A232EIR0_9HYME|nr:hypothetical protein TSAR_004954 [Trichomalopsis sarcophagae]